FEGLYATLLLGLYLWSKNLSHKGTKLQSHKELIEGSSPPSRLGGTVRPQPSPRGRESAPTEPVTVRKYMPYVSAHVCPAFIFLAWFLYFLTQYRTWSDSTPFDFKLFAQFYATMLAVGVPTNIDQWLAPMLVMWAVLLAGAVVGLRGAHGATMRRGGWLVV